MVSQRARGHAFGAEPYRVAPGERGANVIDLGGVCRGGVTPCRAVKRCFQQIAIVGGMATTECIGFAALDEFG